MKMFEIEYGDNGRVICRGRTLDFADLEYISSAGLGILLKTQKRLVGTSAGLKIINVNNHIHDVFRYSGFHTIFDIEAKE